MINYQLTNTYYYDDIYKISALKSLNPLTDQALVIVPEQYTLQAEKDLLQLLATKGLFNIEVLSFKRIVQRVLQAAGKANLEPLTELGKKMILSEIITARSEQLEIYGPSRHNRGFLDQLCDVIVDFRHQNIATSELQSYAQSSDVHPVLKRKLNELTTVYADYLSYLTDDVLDEDGLILVAVDLLLQQSGKRYHTIVVEGFSSMTQSEQKLLIALSKLAKQTTIRVIDDGSPAPIYHYPSVLKNSLQALCHTYAVDFKISKQFNNLPNWARQFSQMVQWQTVNTASGVHLITAPTMDDEVAYCLTDMVKRFQQEGVKWSQMCILTNDLATYHSRVSRLADSFNIPVFIDGRRPAVSHYIVDFILSTLQAITRGMRGRDVIKVLKTGFFDLSYDQICQLENDVIAHDIKGAMWRLVWPWDAQGLQVALTSVLDQLDQLKANLNSSGNAQSMVMTLKAFLGQCNVIAKIVADVDALRQQGDYERAEELAQIHNIIDQVLHQLYHLGSQTTLTSKRFYELLQIGFESHEIGIIPQEQDYVTVGNIKRTRLGGIKVLYLLGLNEGIIPSASAGGGLFNEDELSWLQAQGVKKVRSGEFAYDEEVYKTYENLLKSKDAVYWCRSASDLQGDNTQASLWFERLASAQPITQGVASLSDYAQLGLINPFMDRALLALAQQQPLTAQEQAVMAALKQAGQRALDGFIAGYQGVLTATPIGKDLARQLYGSDLHASVSRLERFVQCPYRHFVDYALKPTQRGEASLTSLDIGDFFHAILERVMNHISSLQIADIQPVHWQHIIDVAFDNYCRTHYRFGLNAKNQYFARRLKSVVSEVANQAIKQLKSQHFSNIKNELSFGSDAYSTVPALRLTVDAQNSIALHGKIDRLDIAQHSGNNYLRIIDYKSSERALDVTDVLHGLNLQLMLYLHVATTQASLWLGQAVNPFGAFYFTVTEPSIELTTPLDDGQIASQISDTFKLDGLYMDDVDTLRAIDDSLNDNAQSNVLSAALKQDGQLRANKQLLSADQLEVVGRYAALKAKRVAQQIFSGDNAVIPVSMGNYTACTYCQYQTICQFDAKKSQWSYREFAKYSSDEALAKIEQEVSTSELND